MSEAKSQDVPISIMGPDEECPEKINLIEEKVQNVRNRPHLWSCNSLVSGFDNYKCPHAGLPLSISSSFMFSLCSLIVKLLDDIPSSELAIFRFLGLLILTLPCLAFRDEPIFPRKDRIYLFLRSILGTVALLCQFYAFQQLPLGDASVIVFSVPIFVSIFARIFLKEECSKFQIVLIVITLMGVILITRPPWIFSSNSVKYSPSEWRGVMAAFASTLVASNVYILLRLLKSLHYTVIIFNFSLISLLITVPVEVYKGEFYLPPVGYKRWLIVLIGILSFFGQVLKTKALQITDAGPVAIARSTDVVFAFLWQLIFFGEIPDILTIIGTFLVTSCVVSLGIRQWMKLKAKNKIIFEEDHQNEETEIETYNT